MLTAILPWIKAYRWVEVLIVVAIAVGAWLWYRHELLAEGEAKIEAADSAARAEQAQLDAATAARWQDQATQAQKERDDATTAYQAYMAAHPVGAVLVCHTNGSGPKPSQAPSAGTGAAPAATSSHPVAAVPTGGAPASTDIGPELDLIVRSAAQMAGLYAECQARLGGLTAQ